MDDYIKRINNNLLEYNLSYNDLEQFRYIGGNFNSHINRFVLECGSKAEYPEPKEYCLCNHKIRTDRNCYIQNNNKTLILVMGSCCIKRFEIDTKKRCNFCNVEHNNRKDNNCSSCRVGLKKWRLLKRNIFKSGKYKDKLYIHVIKTDQSYFKYLIETLKNTTIQKWLKAYLKYEKHL